MTLVQDLINTANSTFPPAIDIGYLLLLSDQLSIGLEASGDDATDELTTTSDHLMVTGARIRLTGALPEPLVAGTDYFVINLTATTLQLAVSLADALAPTPIDLTTAEASFLLSEQQILVTDSFDVLISKELDGDSFYTRTLLTGLSGAASTSPTTADHSVVSVALTNASGDNAVHKHELVIRGGTSTVGDSSGITAVYLQTQPVNQITSPDQVRRFALTFGSFGSSGGGGGGGGD